MTATVPGLVIVREPCARESWVVVHAPSGSAIILDLAGLATAELAAEDLGDLDHLDWTMGAPGIKNAADLLLYVEEAVEAIARKRGGVTLGTEAVYVP